MKLRFLASAMLLASFASATPIRVTITNLAPAQGNFLTPMWVGFHNGSFDIFNIGAAASIGLERIAEDGDTAALSTAFTASALGNAQATITGPVDPPIAPGQTTHMDFNLDGTDALNRYFSYSTMIIPSNDAFIANDDPTAFQIFANDGSFLGASILVLGRFVHDAGTEVNDELPANTAFFGQTVPDTGVNEGGVVHLHPGFNPLGSGGILDDPMFANADFTADGYQVALITVSEIPEPATAGLFVAAAVGAFLYLRRRSA